MMRRLFMIATLLFWLATGFFWWQGRTMPESSAEIAGNKAPTAGEGLFSREEIARHATESDCWMSINQQVYDLSAYIPEHPTRPAVILAWCGQEASEAYRTKLRGRTHSAEADRLLENYRIGRVLELVTPQSAK